MRKFPKEFVDLLSAKGERILRRGWAGTAETFHGRATPFVMLTGVLHERRAASCRRLLDRHLYDQLRAIRAPIPPEAITSMKRNYEEQLPKTMSIKTTGFTRSSAAYRAGREIGLIEMMRSESFARFAEVLTGLCLYRDSSTQLVLYEHGDYSGPHNDHHPENDNCKQGYVDIHITLTSPQVAHQYLVCEQRGFLSQQYSAVDNGTVSVYRLPFWHYTTPLTGKRNQESRARRWVLMGSFDIRPSGA